jgi:transcriptional regulator with XRE-family HTH domain
MLDMGQQVKNLRRSRGLSQSDISDALGISRPTYVAIEAGKRDLTLGELKSLALIFDMSVVSFLDQKTTNAPAADLSKYKELILNCIHYGADPDGKITKTKLAKLVYLADFAWFRLHHKPISGVLYRSLPQGPVANVYFRMVDELYESGAIVIEQNGAAQMIRATEPVPPTSKLSKEQIGLVKTIAEKWRKKNTQEIVEFTHSQIPWHITHVGEHIPYELILREGKGHLY